MLDQHVLPCLIGRDPEKIEDTWQYLYRGANWRRGADGSMWDW
jgi:mannonate dehydratase